MTRPSTTSSNVDIFTQNEHVNEIAIKIVDIKLTLFIKTINKCSDKQNRWRNHKRRILWFNPSFNTSAADNMGKEFFTISWKYSPSTSGLYKIFNHIDVKLSYSCKTNVVDLINKSSTKKKIMNKQHNEPPKCNCINKTDCPLRDKSQ